MMEIEINNQTSFALPRKKIFSVAAAVQKSLRIKKTQSISLAFVSPAKIRRLNKLYRRQDQVTDVLAFSDNEKTAKVDEFAGEILICPLRARKQARELGEKFADEIARLFVHGALHLYGFDHEQAKQAEKMTKVENKILSAIYD